MTRFRKNDFPPLKIPVMQSTQRGRSRVFYNDYHKLLITSSNSTSNTLGLQLKLPDSSASMNYMKFIKNKLLSNSFYNFK